MSFNWLDKIKPEFNSSFFVTENLRLYLYHLKKLVSIILKRSVDVPAKVTVRHRNTIHILSPLAREVINSSLNIRWMSMVELDDHLTGWVRVWKVGDNQPTKEERFSRRSPFEVPFHLEDGDYKIQVLFRGDGVLYSSRKTPITILNKSQLQDQSGSPETDTRRIYCPAPWVKMNVGKFHANPCCNLKRGIRIPYNPEAEGYDPWNSPAMVELRQALVNGDSRFCHPGCSMLNIRTKDDGRKIIEKYKSKKLELFGSIDEERSYKKSLDEFIEGKTFLESQPLNVKMTLNHFCNHACVFCARDIRSSWRADKSMWELLEKYFPGLYSVSFSGGEPLIFLEAAEEKLAKISDSIQDIHFEITTNGSLLLKCAPFLSKLNKLSLIVSFNAGTQESYLRVHRKDHFDRVCEGIQKLKEMRAGKWTRIRLKMVMMKSTFHEIPEFAKVAASMGIDEVKFTPVLFYENSDIDKSEIFSKSDSEWGKAEQLLLTAHQYLESKGVPMRFKYPGDKSDDLTTVPESMLDEFGEWQDFDDEV